MELLQRIPEKYYPQKTDNLFNFKDARSYASINVAATNNSIVDWLYHKAQSDPFLQTNIAKELDNVDFTQLNKFGSSLRNQKAELRICHQICNANKHYKLGDFDPTMKGLPLDLVRVEEDETTVIDIMTVHYFHITSPSSLYGETSSRKSSDEVFQELLRWWTWLFLKIDIPDQQLFFNELHAWQENMLGS